MGGSTSTTQTSTPTNSVTSSAALGQQGTGTTNTGSSQNNLELTGATGNTVTLTAQSPEALAAAGQAIQESLHLAEVASQSSLSYAAQQSAGAQQLATNSTGAGVASLVKTLSLVALAGIGLYFFLRRKGA